jgi:hypothetical protein
VTLLRFDVASVIPAGTVPADVKKAVLKVWINQSKDFTPGGCYLSKVTSSWSEYGSQPFPGQVPTTVGSDKGVVVGIRNQNTFLTFDITSLVQEWVSGTPNLGVALRGKDVVPIGLEPLLSGKAVGMWIDSKENKATAHEPTLQIVLK